MFNGYDYKEYVVNTIKEDKKRFKPYYVNHDYINYNNHELYNYAGENIVFFDNLTVNPYVYNDSIYIPRNTKLKKKYKNNKVLQVPYNYKIKSDWYG